MSMITNDLHNFRLYAQLRTNKSRPMTNLPYHWSKSRSNNRLGLVCAYRLYNKFISGVCPIYNII